MKVHSVIEFLRERGKYRRANPPLHIMDVAFDFNGVLVGPDTQNGLVLVHRVETQVIESIARKVRAFAIALQRTDSMRPVTLVLVGSSPQTSSITELAKLCRVITVHEEAELNEALATLLPLELPSPIAAAEGADAALRKQLTADLEDPFLLELLKAASHSEQEVQQTVRSAVEVLTQVETES